MKKIIHTSNAPAAIGPYNQAVLVDHTLYVSGQIGINPITGELVSDSIESETRQVLLNLQAILNEAGFSFKDVVKCSVFVKDMSQYNRINEVYATFFEADWAPARELVEVANLPRYVNIEISLIAVLSK
jgi:2-iminobutanoate/2-iminopropanoate deaminase